MRNLILILSCTLLFSCSTTNEGKRGEVVNGIEQGGEFSHIENNDFLPVDEIGYGEVEDRFDEDISDHDALSGESIARLPETKLSVVTQSKNNISKVISLCYQKNFTKAFKVLDSIYRRYKNNPAYWNQVGSCHMIRGDRRKALLFYNKALDINKKYVPPINNIGIIHLKNGHHQKALAAFKRAYDLNNFSLTPAYNLASLYLRYGHIEKAKRYYSSLLKSNQNDEDVIFALATVSLIEGNTTKAVNLFRRLKRSKLRETGVGLNYVLALKMNGKTNDAKALFKSIRRAKRESERNYYYRVAKYLEK